MFSRKPIIVANASSQHLRVQILSDTCYESYRSMGVHVNVPVANAGGGVTRETGKKWDVVDKTGGYAVVRRNTFLEFTTDAPKEVCYVTIKSDHKVLYRNHPIPHNRGLIITGEYTLKTAKSNEIWIDKYNGNHDPNSRSYDYAAQRLEDEESFMNMMSTS